MDRHHPVGHSQSRERLIDSRHDQLDVRAARLRFRRPGPRDGAPVRLTDREREIVRLVAEGLTNGEIGGWLFLSPRTVQSHVATAMEKLASPSRTGLAVAAIRRGLIPLHPAADRDRPPTNG